MATLFAHATFFRGLLRFSWSWLRDQASVIGRIPFFAIIIAAPGAGNGGWMKVMHLKLWRTSMWSKAIYIIGMAVLGAGIGCFVTLIRPGRERLGILGASIVTLVGVAILTSILVLSQF